MSLVCLTKRWKIMHDGKTIVIVWLGYSLKWVEEFCRWWWWWWWCRSATYSGWRFVCAPWIVGELRWVFVQSSGGGRGKCIRALRNEKISPCHGGNVIGNREKRLSPLHSGPVERYQNCRYGRRIEALGKVVKEVGKLIVAFREGREKVLVSHTPDLCALSFSVREIRWLGGCWLGWRNLQRRTVGSQTGSCREIPPNCCTFTVCLIIKYERKRIR